MYSDQKIVLDLLGDISAETWIKQKLHNTSCYETKSFAKKHFLKKFTNLTFVSNFTVNELFPPAMSWSNT